MSQRKAKAKRLAAEEIKPAADEGSFEQFAMEGDWDEEGNFIESRGVSDICIWRQELVDVIIRCVRAGR